MKPDYTDAPVTPDHLTTCLNMAIEEAKLSHSLMEAKCSTTSRDPLAGKRIRLEKEIVYFEAKLLQLSSLQS